MKEELKCFKAYDIRGRFPSPLSCELAFALGRAVVTELQAGRVVIGRDARLSGPELEAALRAGLVAEGASVSSVGCCGTEEIYYAAAHKNFDVGIMITGSHNPADENGFKLVRAGAVPVCGEHGLRALRDRAGALLDMGCRPESAPPAQEVSFRAEYVRWLLEYCGADRLKTGARPLRIVADAGNGCAGLVLRELAEFLPFDFVFQQMEPDGHFPNGVPNPLLPERRRATVEAVRRSGADLGIAWDGDFDRCFFYDSEGNFIEGYYCVGLLASEILRHAPGGKIVHDPRVYWNTRELVLAAGGVPIMGKTGHAFMKERMRAEDAVYGGEMSAHHYFRDFAYCDSGMVPWLLLASLLQRGDKPLVELVRERMEAYPCSGEINRRVENAPELMALIRRRYVANAVYEDSLDGINLEFPDWRFSLRMSNTEPLLRLNVETKANKALLEDKTGEILQLMDEFGSASA